MGTKRSSRDLQRGDACGTRHPGARLRLTRPQGYIHDPAGKQCFSGSAVEEDLGCLQYAHSFADSSSAHAADGANDPFSSAHGGSELVSITGSLALLNKACSWVYYEPYSREFSGNDRVDVTISDNGNVGAGGNGGA